MSLLPVSNTFDGGTDTVQTSAANTGGVSGTAFDSVTNGAGVTRVFSSTQKRGLLSMQTVQPATGVTDFGLYSGWGSLLGDVYTRLYIYVNTVSVANHFLVMRTSTPSTATTIGISTAGKFVITNSGGVTAVLTSTLTLTINTWYRIETRIRASATVGQAEYKIFTGSNLEGSVPDETAANANNSALGINIDGCRVGHGCDGSFNFSGGTGYIDDVGFTTAGWLGSSVVIPDLVMAPLR